MSPCTALVMLLMISASEFERGTYVTPKLDSDIARMVRKVDPSWDESTARSPKLYKCIEGVVFGDSRAYETLDFYDDEYAWDVIGNVTVNEAL